MLINDINKYSYCHCHYSNIIYIEKHIDDLSSERISISNRDSEGIQTTPNEVYGVSTDGIETTPNEVYEVSTDGIETTPNEVYGVSSGGKTTSVGIYEVIPINSC